MVELVINKQRAVLPDTASIKLTRTNPMIGTSGDYTLDVTLDLAHCLENRAIFGLLHRPEADLRKLDGKRFPALLTAGHTQMAGAVRVTNTTNESVKVQFLAGKTMLGRGADLNETYINRLNLGNCWNTFPNFKDGDGDYTPGFNRQTMEYLFFHQVHVPAKYGFSVSDMMWGDLERTDTVLLPLYLEDDDVVVNPYDIVTTFEGTRIFVREKNKSYVEDETLIAPMPYLTDIIRRVVAAVGYTLTDLVGLDQPPYSRLIIISTQTADIARASVLPNWTVMEFFEQLENFLGLVFDVDENGGAVVVRKRADIFDPAKMEAQVLTDVLDEVSVDISEDEEPRGTYEGNVVYAAGEEIPAVLCPDPEIYDKAIVVKRDTFEKVFAFYLKLSDKEKKKSQYIFRVTSTGDEYAILRTVPRDLYLKVVNPSTIVPTKLKVFSQYAHLQKWFREEIPEELNDGVWLIKVQRTGTYYTIGNRQAESQLWDIRRIGQYGGLYRNEKDYGAVTELKIVPARLSFLDKRYLKNEAFGVEVTSYERLVPPENGVPVLSTTQNFRLQRSEFSVDRELNPSQYYYEDDDSENGADNAPDILQVAYYNPANTYEGIRPNNDGWTDGLPIALGMTYGENVRTGQWERLPLYDASKNKNVYITDLGTDGFFRLRPGTTPFDNEVTSAAAVTSVGTLLAASPVINPAAEHSIEYIDRNATDPRKLFLVRGKRYVASKIEMTMTPKGEDPLRRAYLFEVE